MAALATGSTARVPMAGGWALGGATGFSIRPNNLGALAAARGTGVKP